MKYFLGSLLSIMISISAFAQNSPGVDYLSLGEIKLAKDYFTKNMGQSPAESHYYLGEIALQEGNTAEAKSHYEKGLAADPESGLNAIGLAKLELKSNQKEAENKLKDVQKKNKKDVTVILAIAKAYLDNGMKDLAMEKLQDARKADKKDPNIYIFEGDILAKENKPGDAARQYDQAINFDEKCALAYMKGARVYKDINMDTAIDMLTKAAQARPDLTIVGKELGDLYRNKGMYGPALEAYKKYFTGGDYTTEDIIRYASTLYFTGSYDESLTLLEEGLAKEPNNFVLNRLVMYNNNGLKDYQSGLKAGEKFFNLPLNKGDSILSLDYKVYANILSEVGNKAKAVEQYKKLIELAPTDRPLYKEVATFSADANNYNDATSLYSKYMELAPDSVDAQDYFILGRYYYWGGAEAAKDSISVTPAEAKVKAKDMYTKADAAFATVAERMPASHLGVYWRARTNVAMDPESTAGLAKPYYEETIKVILAKEDKDAADNRPLLEAYSYLAYYYYLQFVDHGGKAEDKANMKSNAEKVLEIDPENSTGKALYDFANQ
ncbi:MAG: tetratricopeptide repeat protein [Prevotella sp.]|nr:tetratricopeptide repeat protein [Prevotella sp.]